MHNRKVMHDKNDMWKSLGPIHQMAVKCIRVRCHSLVITLKVYTRVSPRTCFITARAGRRNSAESRKKVQASTTLDTEILCMGVHSTHAESADSEAETTA